MLKTKEKLFEELAAAVATMDETKALALAAEVVDLKLDIQEALLKGVAKGMDTVGRKYESGEYFVPQMLVCADVMTRAVDFFKPHLPKKNDAGSRRIVIGVVEGDTHDIGKNLVKIMLESSGFTVFDLGRDVPVQLFIDEAQRTEADIICLSTLMTTAMDGMAHVVRLLVEQGIREQHKVLIGGGPVSKAFAIEIGADGYASNAVLAVQKAKELLCKKK